MVSNRVEVTSLDRKPGEVVNQLHESDGIGDQILVVDLEHVFADPGDAIVAATHPFLEGLQEILTHRSIEVAIEHPARRLHQAGDGGHH